MLEESNIFCKPKPAKKSVNRKRTNLNDLEPPLRKKMVVSANQKLAGPKIAVDQSESRLKSRSSRFMDAECSQSVERSVPAFKKNMYRSAANGRTASVISKMAESNLLEDIEKPMLDEDLKLLDEYFTNDDLQLKSLDTFKGGMIQVSKPKKEEKSFWTTSLINNKLDSGSGLLRQKSKLRTTRCEDLVNVDITINKNDEDICFHSNEELNTSR